jgi:hypothetical protein
MDRRPGRLYLLSPREQAKQEAFDREPGAPYLYLARDACAHCAGTGREARQVCACVYRAIFQQCMRCYQQWGEILEEGGCVRPRFDPSSFRYTFPTVEYRVDVDLTARRILDDGHFDVFRLHERDGLDWQPVCAKLRIDRGEMFHRVYRLRAALGREMARREICLFPIGDYFGRSLDRTVVGQFTQVRSAWQKAA